MNWRKSVTLLPLVASLAVLAGCGVDTTQAPDDGVGPRALPASLQPANVRITNDPAVLESRIVRASTPIEIRSSGTSDRNDVAEKSTSNVRLTLVGTVRAPVVDGHTVQAHDVDIRDKTAVVAYNFAGETFAGAVQVIDFKRPERPEIVAEVLYRAADVDAVVLHGSHLYVGLASADPALATPAMLQALEYTPSKGIEETGDWLDLPSWSVTDLDVEGDDLLAAVGARDGGLVLVRRNGSMSIQSFAPAADVRGVAKDGNMAMSVRGGEAMLSRHELPSLGASGNTGIDGYRTAGAKGTIEVYEHRCYLGAGEGGFQVRGSDGALLASVRPTLTANVDPRLAVINAVSVTNEYGFLAAGSQGVLVVNLGRYRCDGRSSEDDTNVALLGSLMLEDGASSNMVKAKNNILVVAAGAGGVKLISMSEP